MPPLPRPFPAGGVRDALGFVRLLWIVERAGVDLDRLKALTEIGETLVQCLKLGRLRPESLGYKGALNRSADAMDRLAAPARSADVAEVVRGARCRVVGAETKREDERDARRKAADARR